MADREVRHRVTVDTGGAEGNLGRLARAWEALRGILDRTRGVMRNVKGGMDSVGQSAATSGTGVGGLTVAAGKLGIAMAALGAVLRSVRNGFRELGQTVEAAVNFQSQAFQVRMLTGSMKEARNVLLQLTESSQAVDHIFGTQTVVDAYRALHNYTGGALASAYAVRVLGQASLVTGKEISSMADSVGRAWQMIVAGESMNRAGRRLIDGGLVDQSFINDLQRMQDEGRSATDIFMALWREIEGRGDGALDGYAQTIQGMRQEIEDLKSISRTAFGEFFQPMVDSWTRVKLFLARDIADFARNASDAGLGSVLKTFYSSGGLNPMTAQAALAATYVRYRGEREYSELTRDQFLAMSPEEQEAAIRQTQAVSPDMAQEQMRWRLEQESERQRQQQLTDWLSQRDRRQEEDRMAGMSSDELYAEAVRYGLQGATPDPLRHEQMMERAQRAAAREAEDRESQRERQRAARERRIAEEGRARDRLEEATFRSALGLMDPEDQISALSDRRDAELELATEAKTAGDAVKQFHHELRALNVQDQIRGVMQQIENEERRRADDIARFEDQKREHELRQMDPATEIQQRQERIERDRAALESTPERDHDQRMALQRRMWGDERRIADLEGREGPSTERDHNRRGLQAFIHDLVNVPELSSSSVVDLSGEGRTRSITDRFSDRLTEGRLTNSEAGRLSREAGASAIERMQMELDNERNRLLRQLIEKQGVTD